MNETRSRSIETPIKRQFFRLLDVYAVLQGKASRLQSLWVGVLLIGCCIVFTFVYILFFAYLPSENDRSSLVSLLAESSEPPTPIIHRLLTDQSLDDLDWEEYATSSVRLSYPANWILVDESEEQLRVQFVPEQSEKSPFVRISTQEFQEDRAEQNLCFEDGYDCDKKSISGQAYQRITMVTQANTVQATLSATQRDILYRIEYQFSQDRAPEAEVIDAILESIEIP